MNKQIYKLTRSISDFVFCIFSLLFSNKAKNENIVL